VIKIGLVCIVSLQLMSDVSSALVSEYFSMMSFVRICGTVAGSGASFPIRVVSFAVWNVDCS